MCIDVSEEIEELTFHDWLNANDLIVEADTRPRSPLKPRYQFRCGFQLIPGEAPCSGEVFLRMCSTEGADFYYEAGRWFSGKPRVTDGWRELVCEKCGKVYELPPEDLTDDYY